MIKTDFLQLFVLAHLVGDFVLQTDKIAKMKSESISGVLYHVLVVSTVQVLCMSFFGIKGIAAALIVSVLHFIIDFAKGYINKYLKRLQFAYFAFDQLVHLGIIYAVTCMVMGSGTVNTSMPLHIKLPMFFILAAYVLTVGVKILLFDLFPRHKDKGFFLKSERLIDAITALVLLGSSEISIYGGMVTALAGYYFYFKLQNKRFAYRAGAVVFKYSFLALNSLIISIL